MPVLIALKPGAAALWDAGNVKGVWMNYVRYVGAGAIAMGGFLSLVRSIPLFLRTFRNPAGKAMTAQITELDDDELSFRVEGLKPGTKYSFVIEGVRKARTGRRQRGSRSRC